jgi:predicted RNA binding protein YcfA (HicA-like mRNA interferase family)
MSGQHPPLSCADVKRILRSLGFAPLPRKGTSHEQWAKTENGKRFKVTVDCPKQPFSHNLIRYMAAQI